MSLTGRMTDDERDDLDLKMVIFLSSAIDEEQLALLYQYTKKHTLADFVASMEVAQQTRALLQMPE